MKKMMLSKSLLGMEIDQKGGEVSKAMTLLSRFKDRAVDH